jgi:hypothetical protein
MEYNLDNVKCKYPKIISSGTFDEIIKLLNTLDEKEEQLNVINTHKIKLELEVEALKKIVEDFKPLIEIVPKNNKKVEEVIQDVDHKKPLPFGIISSGPGNTRIG